MKTHNFEDSDLRILASFAIDLYTDHLFFKVFRTFIPLENYWSIDCRFSVSEDEIETYYDSLHISSGNHNKPECYQMRWTEKKNESFKMYPITSPLVVVHYFEEMCKKQEIQMN